MGRGKMGTKSGWRKRDQAYRDQERTRRRNNSARRMFRWMAGKIQ